MSSQRRGINRFTDAKYEYVIVILEGITKEELKGDMNKSVDFQIATQIVRRLLATYEHNDSVNASKSVVQHIKREDQLFINGEEFIDLMKKNISLKLQIDAAKKN